MGEILKLKTKNDEILERLKKSISDKTTKDIVLITTNKTSDGLEYVEMIHNLDDSLDDVIKVIGMLQIASQGLIDNI